MDSCTKQLRSYDHTIIVSTAVYTLRKYIVLPHSTLSYIVENIESNSSCVQAVYYIIKGTLSCMAKF